MPMWGECFPSRLGDEILPPKEYNSRDQRRERLLTIVLLNSDICEEKLSSKHSWDTKSSLYVIQLWSRSWQLWVCYLFILEDQITSMIVLFQSHCSPTPWNSVLWSGGHSEGEGEEGNSTVTGVARQIVIISSALCRWSKKRVSLTNSSH